MPGTFSLGESTSEPKTSPVFSWKLAPLFFGPVARKFRGFSKKGGEQDQLYDQWKTDYLANSGNAAANAQIYTDYAKNLFANQPNQMQDYRGVGDYLFGKFNDFRDTSSASGMRDMNSQLARLGIRPGSTGYDRLLNANRITNNLAPAFMNTTNAIGRDYNSINANRMNDVGLRLGLARDDALTGYQDRSIARPLDVADERFRQINNDVGTYMNLSDAYNKNIAGYQTVETNDFSKVATVADNMLNGVLNGYGGYGGSSAPSNPNTKAFQPANQGGNNPYVESNPWTSAGASTNPDGSSMGGSGDMGGELGGAAAASSGGGGYSSYYGGGV